ncbi:hypothetical protein ES288_D12G098100v1 [Gossypium darwinii]|uniref:Uncharacterized protein n=2 Tax=Gossypium TaxID=3633 RepID=A0A5D2I855_GOSTO|nr:hypothetical protein ES288_D12G098100v1 [Gossypium darwinii]TYH38126.1 hypothetical protein ES332_D12G089100v1 [Gossypium tomentosum]
MCFLRLLYLFRPFNASKQIHTLHPHYMTRTSLMADLTRIICCRISTICLSEPFSCPDFKS